MENGGDFTTAVAGCRRVPALYSGFETAVTEVGGQFVARLEPENNTDLIIEAFPRTHSRGYSILWEKGVHNGEKMEGVSAGVSGAD